jgi:hypothetical protein
VELERKFWRHRYVLRVILLLDAAAGRRCFALALVYVLLAPLAGGLVDDGWEAIQWNKIDYLTTVGLTPWGGDAQEVGDGIDSSPYPSPNPSPSPQPSPASQPAPKPPTEPSPKPSPKPSPSSSRRSCQVKIKTENAWKDGSKYSGSFKILIKNKGSTTVNAPWELTIAGPRYSKLLQTWNWNAKLYGKRSIKGTAEADWLSIEPNKEVSVGIQVQGSSKRLRPKSVTLNGAKCSLV